MNNVMRFANKPVKNRIVVFLWKIFPAFIGSVVIVWALLSSSHEPKPDLGIVITVIILFPFVDQIRSLVFSPFISDKFPNENPVYKSGWSIRMIYPHSKVGDYGKWTLFPSGLGVNLLPATRFFIPYEDIMEVKRTNGILFSGNRVIHRHPVLHSPLELPDEAFELLRQKFDEYQEKKQKDI
jgi:hypothetical protein